jgi:hypothetical protein
MKIDKKDITSSEEIEDKLIIQFKKILEKDKEIEAL